MDQYVYIEIVNEVLLPYARDQIPLLWVFQQNNDPKQAEKQKMA